MYFSHSLRVTELFCCDQDLVALLSPDLLMSWSLFSSVILVGVSGKNFFALSNLSEDLPTPTYTYSRK